MHNDNQEIIEIAERHGWSLIDTNTDSNMISFIKTFGGKRARVNFYHTTFVFVRQFDNNQEVFSYLDRFSDLMVVFYFNPKVKKRAVYIRTADLIDWCSNTRTEEHTTWTRFENFEIEGAQNG